jgi:ATP-dependent Clp protease ATP-binding subunit ClpC
MANKMQRFTQSARRVLGYAQDEANYLHSSFIGTEHMLVALVREEHGIAGKVLRELGANKQEVQALVEKLTGSAEPRMTSAPPELSPGVKRVLELAVGESRRIGSDFVDTEQLLLGLLRLPESTAANILSQLHIKTEDVQRRVEQETSQKNGGSASPQ